MLSKIVALSLAAAASAFAPAALPGRVTSRGEQRHTLAQQLRRGALRGSERAAARDLCTARSRFAGLAAHVRGGTGKTAFMQGRC
jgi:hypothetical protein